MTDQLMQQIMALRDIVMEMKGTVDTLANEQARAWQSNRSDHDRMVDKIERVENVRIELENVKSTATIAKDTLEEHVENHKWWFGTLITICTAIAGGIIYVMENYPKIRDYVTR